MSEPATVLEAALALPERERAEVALRLIESLDGPSDDGAEEAWAEVVAKRVDDLRAGRVKTIPADEAFARAEGRLRARRG